MPRRLPRRRTPRRSRPGRSQGQTCMQFKGACERRGVQGQHQRTGGGSAALYPARARLVAMVLAMATSCACSQRFVCAFEPTRFIRTTSVEHGSATQHGQQQGDSALGESAGARLGAMCARTRAKGMGKAHAKRESEPFCRWERLPAALPH